MDLTDSGRIILVVASLLVMGFALGTVSRIAITNETAIALIGGAAALLLLSARRGRNGVDGDGSGR